MNFKGIISTLMNIGNSLIYLMITLGVFYFLWGLFGYMKNSDDVKGREESRKFIIYGLIGIFVMTAVWGLVNVLTETFGLGAIGIPQIKI